MIAFRKSNQVLAFVLIAAVLVFAGEAAALSDTPDVHVPQITAGTVVYAIVQSGNTVYVGGTFTQIGGVARNSLAAFDATTGVVDPAWDPNIASQTVFALAVSNDKVYVCGNFNWVNGFTVARNRLAAFNLADGVSPAIPDPAWDPNLSNDGMCVAVSGGKVYACGGFSWVNGYTVTRNRLAAFNLADGVSPAVPDPAWDPDLNGWATALAVLNNKVYVGGAFSTVKAGTITRNRLAAFNLADGSSPAIPDPAWDPSLSTTVYALAASSSRLYVAGAFTSVNGGATTRNHLAAFNLADGSSPATPDPAWDPDLNSTVYALTTSGAKLYVAGAFASVNGGATARNRLAAFNLADGSSAATADPWNPNASSIARALAPSGSGGVLTGGFFTMMGGNPQLYLAGFGAGPEMPLSWIPVVVVMFVVALLVVVRRKARSAQPDA